MENISTNPSIEMYRLDLEELLKISSQVTRPNLKRTLEQYRTEVEALLAVEKKKLEVKKSKENSTVPTKEIVNFIPVSKYALDSGDKFVK